MTTVSNNRTGVYHYSIAVSLVKAYQRAYSSDISSREIREKARLIASCISVGSLSSLGRIKLDFGFRDLAFVSEFLRRLLPGETSIEGIPPEVWRFRSRHLETAWLKIFYRIVPRITFYGILLWLQDKVGSKQSENVLPMAEDALREAKEEVESADIPTVYIVNDPTIDKISQIDRILEISNFLNLLKNAREASGKSPENYSIVIKPNISMCIRKSDDGTYTDPHLVQHLVARLNEAGYPNVTVVESQNLYGLWYKNRETIKVVARAGYLPEGNFFNSNCEAPASAEGIVLSGGNKTAYRVCDLTLDTIECDLGPPPCGRQQIGRIWAEADFRINFPKNKTHFYSYYTLGLKNSYGCLPVQNKMIAYHKKHITDRITAYQFRKYPVHFSILDGYTSADGILGVKVMAVSRKTKTMLASTDTLALDGTGAFLMGLDPFLSKFYQRAAALAPPLRHWQLSGDSPKFYRPWSNMLPGVYTMTRILEHFIFFFQYLGSIFIGGSDPHFPLKRPVSMNLMRIISLTGYPIIILSDYKRLKLIARKASIFIHARFASGRFRLAARRADIRLGLSRLEPEDLPLLLDIIRKVARHNTPGIEKPEVYGHQIRIGERLYSFPAAHHPITEWAAGILSNICKNKLNAEELATELDLWAKTSLFKTNKKA